MEIENKILIDDWIKKLNPKVESVTYGSWDSQESRDEVTDPPEEVIDEISSNAIAMGDPALSHLCEKLSDKTINLYWKRNIVKIIEKFGEASLPYLKTLLDKVDYNTIQLIISTMQKYQGKAVNELVYALNFVVGEWETDSLINCLAEMGTSSLPLYRKAYTEGSLNVKIHIIRVLEKIGEPAFDLIVKAIEDENSDVRTCALSAISTFGKRGREYISRAIEDPNGDVRLKAATYLITQDMDQTSIDLVRKVVQDPDVEVRRGIIQFLNEYHGYHIPSSYLQFCILFVEDSYPRNADDAWYIISRVVLEGEISIGDLIQLIVDELVVRKPDLLESRFNPEAIKQVLVDVLKADRDQKQKVLEKLSLLTIEHKDNVWKRAVDLGKIVDDQSFVVLIKERLSTVDNSIAMQIMERIGGTESTAFFAKMQSLSLAQYRAPLVELEKISRKRWEELTQQSNLSLRISTIMSITLFVVGTVIVLWGLVLITLSQQPSQQVIGLISAIVGAATAYSGRFWRDPVEHIQRFTSQQARLQIAFIGYMNRIAQLRIQFEDDYSGKKITINELERYQDLLENTINQASKQMFDTNYLIGNEKSETKEAK